MEYHFVVAWSEKNGWIIDWESTIARFKGNNVFIPNLNEWVFPSKDTETGNKEAELSTILDKVLEQLNK